MKILLVSTLKRKVTKEEFASRSRIIYQLGEGLAKRGHLVSLVGTNDSYIPGVTTVPILPAGWVDLPPTENEFAREVATLIQMGKKIVDVSSDFDIIHNHTYPDFFTPSIAKDVSIPMLTTMHALAEDYIDDVLHDLPNSHYAALSKAYATLYSKTKIEHVVYNGVDTSLYAFSPEKKDYLLWLGRLPKGKNADGTFIDPKGVRWAIQLAQKTGQKLLLGGVVEDPAFFEKDVKPHLADTIEWVGEVGPKQSIPIEKVVELFQNAKAFLMTVNQPEPFGLVMAEAMSCGTPVIGFNRGSVPEVVADGVTGYVVDYEKGVNGLVEAVNTMNSLSAEEYTAMVEASRKRVEDNFTVEKMVENYEKVYEKIVKKD